MPEIRLVTSSPRETESVAARLAAALEEGDVLFLEGDLGGGKTTFTRGLLRGLDHPDPREVASPTYALHHRYVGGRLPVDHLDLYRLDNSVEGLERQGLLDPVAGRRSVVVIEWSERLGQRGPRAVLRVLFLFRGERRRELVFSPREDAFERFAKALAPFATGPGA